MINRIEKKFILKKNILNDFINYLEIKKKMKKKFLDRRINSIYFDNINNKFVLENLEGFAKRVKLRFRWYNQNEKMISHEIKIKKGNKTKKIIKKINLEKSIFDILKNGDLEKFIDIKFKIEDKFRPSCMISYDRSYYLSNLCRITIDNNIKYFDINNSKLNPKFFKDDLIVVELKINEEDFDSFFETDFNLGSLINVRMSKYMRARSFFLNFEYF